MAAGFLIGWDIFDFSSESVERNSTKLDRKQDLNVLLSKKQDCRPGLWLAETFSTSLNPLNGIQQILTGSKISTSSTTIVFFGPIGKTRWPSWPLIGWDIYDFSSESTKWNSTNLDRKQDLNVLYQVCVFRADRKNKMTSDWLRHFRLLLWNRQSEFNETWQKARSQHLLSSLCFLGRSENQDCRPGLWLAETFSTSLNPLNGIQQILTGSKISTSSTTIVFFGPIGKTRWPSWPLIGWDIYDFSSESTKWNSTNLDRKQDLNVLYQVCVFRADRKNKMTSDWLRHFRLLLWNRQSEFNETWQKARSQHLLSSLCFLGRSENQDCRPGLWLAETFSTSLNPLNGIQQILTGSKISTSSIKFVFFGPIGKTRWPLIGWDIFDFSSETANRNSTKLDRKQDLNIFYQVCVFWADRKIKMAALASDLLRHFRLLLWNRWSEFKKSCQEARPQRPLSSLCNLGKLEKQDDHPGLSFKDKLNKRAL